MKQVERQKIAYALRESLPYLWNGRREAIYGKSEFICFALNRTAWSGAQRVREAQKMIHSRIAPHATVECWLEAQGVKRIGQRKLQAYRKAWMIKLIEEFSK